MENANEELPLSARINRQLKINTELDEVDPDDTNITKQNLLSFEAILKRDNPTGIDFSKNTPPPADPTALPEYMSEFKELLETPFTPFSDETNYTERAVKEFGPEYANINSKESFESEMVIRNARETYLQSPQVKGVLAKITDAINGVTTPRSILTDLVSNETNKYTPNREQVIKDIVEGFFDGEKLNETGQSEYNEVIAKAKNAAATFKQNAEKHAQDTLSQHLNFQKAIQSEVKTFKPGGVELPESLQADLVARIDSGQVNEWLNETAKTPEEAARKELLLAIISSPRAYAEWVNLVDKRGIHYGENLKSMKFFKTPN